ncbi:hypothetical protein ACA910_011764 [Epithemia clementina (nom. ined.)]
MWKNIRSTEKAYCEKLAAQEKARHSSEMSVWRKARKSKEATLVATENQGSFQDASSMQSSNVINDEAFYDVSPSVVTGGAASGGALTSSQEETAPISTSASAKPPGESIILPSNRLPQDRNRITNGEEYILGEMEELYGMNNGFFHNHHQQEDGRDRPSVNNQRISSWPQRVSRMDQSRLVPGPEQSTLEPGTTGQPPGNNYQRGMNDMALQQQYAAMMIHYWPLEAAVQNLQLISYQNKQYSDRNLAPMCQGVVRDDTLLLQQNAEFNRKPAVTATNATAANELPIALSTSGHKISYNQLAERMGAECMDLFLDIFRQSSH